MLRHLARAEQSSHRSAVVAQVDALPAADLLDDVLAELAVDELSAEAILVPAHPHAQLVAHLEPTHYPLARPVVVSSVNMHFGGGAEHVRPLDERDSSGGAADIDDEQLLGRPRWR